MDSNVRMQRVKVHGMHVVMHVIVVLVGITFSRNEGFLQEGLFVNFGEGDGRLVVDCEVIMAQNRNRLGV